MSEEQSRTPLSVRGSASDLVTGPFAETMTFGPGLAGANGKGTAPHPDFLARAAIWRDHKAGLLSLGEARRRSSEIGALEGVTIAPAPAHRRAPRARKLAPPPRHARPAPRDSRQYSGAMATTAARDDRLTPHAKAFLQVLRARCGKTRETAITKGTMGAVMARSARTIRRYLVDLLRLGYIELETRRNARGLHTGLVVRITDKVLPFYEEAKGLARWLAESPKAAALPFTGTISPRFPGVTLLSSNNQLPKNPSLLASSSTRLGAWDGLIRLGREEGKGILAMT